MLRKRTVAASRRMYPSCMEALEPRQLMSSGPVPFHGTPFVPGQLIEAEDFDIGGEGISYHDTTSTNTGNISYRSGAAVDTQVGGSNGVNVGYCFAGEWLDYTVNIPAAGNYSLTAATANTGTGGAFHVLFGTFNKTGTMTVPNNGSWSVFQTSDSATFTLPAGTQVMRVVLDKGSTKVGVANFDYFRLNNVTPPPPDPGKIKLKWSTAAKAHVGRTEASALSISGKLYLFGGYYQDRPHYVATTVTEAYDPTTNVWTNLADEPSAVTHVGYATDGRYAYLAGGYVSNPVKGSQTFASTAVWRYDTVADTWSSFVPLPAARGAGAMVMLGRELHFIGGVDTSRAGHKDHWILNLDDIKPHWTASTPIPAARNHMTAEVLNGKIYMVGGQPGTNDAAPVADVLVWDPASPAAWTFLKSLPAPRSHESLVVANGKLIAIAGVTTGESVIPTVVVYDPTLNTWTSVASLPTRLAAPVAGLVGDTLVVTSGSIGLSLLADTYVSLLS